MQKCRKGRKCRPAPDVEKSVIPSKMCGSEEGRGEEAEGENRRVDEFLTLTWGGRRR